MAEQDKQSDKMEVPDLTPEEMRIIRANMERICKMSKEEYKEYLKKKNEEEL